MLENFFLLKVTCNIERTHLYLLENVVCEIVLPFICFILDPMFHKNPSWFFTVFLGINLLCVCKCLEACK